MSILKAQISRILKVGLSPFMNVGNTDAMAAAEESVIDKLVALCEPNTNMMVAAASLEAETTELLMQMHAATILATLLEEEGGGRANISYSPLSMDHMMKHYTFTAEKTDMITTVRISLREDSSLNTEEGWREPSNRHGVMQQDESPAGALPQAEPKVHDRPLWMIRSNGELWRMMDRRDAERQLPNYIAHDPTAVLENRHCDHLFCPSTGCTKEVTSNG